MNNFKKKSIMEESMDSVRTFNSDQIDGLSRSALTLSVNNSRRDSNRNSVDDADFPMCKTFVGTYGLSNICLPPFFYFLLDLQVIMAGNHFTE